MRIRVLMPPADEIAGPVVSVDDVCGLLDHIADFCFEHSVSGELFDWCVTTAEHFECVAIVAVS